MSDGSILDGEYRRGRRHGMMKWTLQSGLVYTGIFQNDQPLGRGKWEIDVKSLAQHGEYVHIEGEIENEEEEQQEEEDIDEVPEPEEKKPEKVVTVWMPDVELSRDFDELKTTPSWYLMPVDE